MYCTEIAGFEFYIKDKGRRLGARRGCDPS
jgi:hypothetical protein